MYNIVRSHRGSITADQHFFHLNGHWCRQKSSAAPPISPQWNVGKSIRDRKSLFVGRYHWADSVEQARLLVDRLKGEKELRKATHNIWACRINESEYAYDDDGEKPAGERLLTHLKRTNATNALVLVTRWYGGISLGSVRFKHIHECAKDALP